MIYYMTRQMYLSIVSTGLLIDPEQPRIINRRG